VSLNRDVGIIEIMEGGHEPWWLILMLVVYTYTKCNHNHLLALAKDEEERSHGLI
jgi:hypothetical protein